MNLNFSAGVMTIGSSIGLDEIGESFLQEERKVNVNKAVNKI